VTGQPAGNDVTAAFIIEGAASIICCVTFSPGSAEARVHQDPGRLRRRRAGKLAKVWALALGYVTQSLPEGFSSLEEFFRSIGYRKRSSETIGRSLIRRVTGRRCTSSGYPRG
jgi:hypothetical protein